MRIVIDHEGVGCIELGEQQILVFILHGWDCRGIVCVDGLKGLIDGPVILEDLGGVQCHEEESVVF